MIEINFNVKYLLKSTTILCRISLAKYGVNKNKENQLPFNSTANQMY